MALPVPNLDDRRFQDLVDEAKRMVQQRCPEWSDHNVSDPGVTLIEAFAAMTDQLVYRLNRVPDKLYVQFLDLIGVELFPPSAARVLQTFWLSAAQTKTVTVPEGTRVATPRGEARDAISFTTTASLDIVPCSLAHVRTGPSGGATSVSGDEQLAKGEPVVCFSNPPMPDDSILLGLSDAVPSCAVAFRLDCTIQGIGVDPDDPPLAWEAWTPHGWQACDVGRDDTGGLNVSGDVVVHVPAEHAASLVGNQRAAWLRARVLPAREGQTAYSSPPIVRAASAMTVGGSVEAVNAVAHTNEILGVTQGVPGETFTVAHPPVVSADSAVTVEVSGPEGWRQWTSVPDFAASGPRDRHVTIDGTTGQIRFGPGVREADGSLRQFGKLPEAGATVRVRRYLSGGGLRGNVRAGSVTVLKTTVPFVARTENRSPATGGRDAEDIDNAKRRGPLALRAHSRAVTADDYADIAFRSTPEFARVRAVAAEEPGGVRVLVVPAVPVRDGPLRFEQLQPAEDSLRALADAIDERRVIGTRISVGPPVYQGFTVVVRVQPRPDAVPQTVQSAVLDALNRHFDPLVGGEDGCGWPFGRPVHLGEVYAAVQRVPGVDIVGDARLFAADPVTGRRGESMQRIDVPPDGLVFSFEHQVQVRS